MLASASLGTVLMLTITGCNTSETLRQGYVLEEGALDFVPLGSSREQVLLTLGTPSTKATFDNEVFYYISQTRKRGAGFMKAKLVEQKVLAIYFDDKDTVGNIANYALKDGKVFDTISRTTPTGGNDRSFLAQMFSSLGGSKSSAVRNIFGG